MKKGMKKELEINLPQPLCYRFVFNTQANLTHEFGYLFLSTIKDDSVLDEFKTLYKQEYEQGGITGEDFQERFCVDLENYIASGEARNEGLRSIFEQIVRAMTNFVEYIRGLSFENKEEVIQAFDNLFQEGTVENIQRVQESKTSLNSIKNVLDKISSKFKENETIDSLISEVNSAIELLNDSTTEDKSALWQDLKQYASDLREELSSAIENTELAKDEDISALMESISSSSLAKLMNNRPQVYTKRVNNLDSDSGNSNEKSKNRKSSSFEVDGESRTQLEFKGKELVASSITNNDVEAD